MQSIIGYIRVSTEEQAKEGLSLDAQSQKLFAWGEHGGRPLTRIEADEGKSGGRADNRPALQAALSEVCRTGGVLVVTALDRLARSTIDACTILDRLSKAGADLVSLSENIDTTTASGRMIFGIMAVIAEFERGRISERGKAIASYRRSQGLVHGKVRYGYDLTDDGHEVQNETEQATILRMLALRHSHHYSLQGIACILEREGVRTKTGKKCWSKRLIGRIISEAENGDR